MGDLILDHWEVIGKVQRQNGMKLLDPIKCPELPFVIARGGKGYYLINIDEKRVQLLVEATHFAT